MQGKLRKKYIGALLAMTIARLEEVAGDLEMRARCRGAWQQIVIKLLYLCYFTL